MTTDVIRLAREANGALITEDYPGHTGQLDPWTLRLLERFAALIMEECAETCDEYTGPDYDTVSDILAAAIRARKPA